MSRSNHWEKVYRSKPDTDVSWYRPHLEISLDLIHSTGADKEARIIDVGGGASTLVDDLLDDGYRHLTVVDLAESALDVARKRLGARAENVQWIAGDITQIDLPCRQYDIWHDRAVFHFLTSDADRKAYIEHVCCAVREGGHVIIATFGPHGPTQCSGLPVHRYSSDELQEIFGRPFVLTSHIEETHHTPGGAVQEFVYCCCLKSGECG